MPIPPPSCHYQCPACGWSKTVRPSSDDLTLGYDYFHSCPRCRHTPLQTTSPAPNSMNLGDVLNVIAQWLSKK
jgi:hypothetical protein